MPDKAKLREELKAKRRSLNTEEIRNASKKITLKILEEVKGAKCVMAYLCAFKEVSVDAVIETLLNQGVTVCVPITDDKNMTMTPCVIESLDKIKHGAYKIREPIELKEIKKESIDAVIVPGIGFDKTGNRIGFGCGYYDRFLEGMAAKKIGVCYGFSVVSEIPADKNDIPMDIIITESEKYAI